MALSLTGPLPVELLDAVIIECFLSHYEQFLLEQKPENAEWDPLGTFLQVNSAFRSRAIGIAAPSFNIAYSEINGFPSLAENPHKLMVNLKGLLLKLINLHPTSTGEPSSGTFVEPDSDIFHETQHELNRLSEKSTFLRLSSCIVFYQYACQYWREPSSPKSHKIAHMLYRHMERNMQPAMQMRRPQAVCQRFYTLALEGTFNLLAVFKAQSFLDRTRLLIKLATYVSDETQQEETNGLVAGDVNECKEIADMTAWKASPGWPHSLVPVQNIQDGLKGVMSITTLPAQLREQVVNLICVWHLRDPVAYPHFIHLPFDVILSSYHRKRFCPTVMKELDCIREKYAVPAGPSL